MSRIAGQLVLARQRRNAAVPQPAETAFGGSPERPVRIQSKAVHSAFPEPIGGRKRGANLAFHEIHDAALIESRPEAAPHGINDQRHRIVFMSQPGPWNLFGAALTEQMNQPAVLVSDPQTTG